MKNTAKLLGKTALVLSMAFGAAQGSDLTLGDVAKIVKNEKADKGIDEDKLADVGGAEFGELYNRSSKKRQDCFEETILNENRDVNDSLAGRYKGYLFNIVEQYNDQAKAGNAERYAQIPFKKIVSRHMEGICPSDTGAPKPDNGQAKVGNTKRYAQGPF